MLCGAIKSWYELQEDVDKFMDGRSKIMLGDEPKGSESEDDEDDVDVVRSPTHKYANATTTHTVSHKHTLIHTRAHTQPHTHTQTHAHTHMHTYTQIGRAHV